VEFTYCTSLVTSHQKVTKDRCTNVIRDITDKMSDTSTKISVPQRCGIILLETLDILVEYSSTR